MISKSSMPIGTLVIFLALTVLTLSIYIYTKSTARTVPKELIAVLRPQATPLRPFTLIDQDNLEFTQQRFKGKWSMVFFGYTFCPDICPTTLSILRQVHQNLDRPNNPQNTQAVFVSIDPERDTPEIIKRYTQYFGDKFIGVTGLPGKLASFSKQFGASYLKEPGSSPEYYQMAHTASIFLVDPQVRIIATFSPPHQAGTITDQFRDIYDLYNP